jgi:hypothetical protein
MKRSKFFGPTVQKLDEVYTSLSTLMYQKNQVYKNLIQKQKHIEHLNTSGLHSPSSQPSPSPTPHSSSLSAPPLPSSLSLLHFLFYQTPRQHISLVSMPLNHLAIETITWLVLVEVDSMRYS